MNILPAFDTSGNLPEAVYDCDKAMLYKHFVQAFPHSVERPLIYDGFCNLHSTLEALGVSATQWVDGSFTTRKLNPLNLAEELEPGDIDVLTFIDANVLRALPISKQQLLTNLVGAGDSTKAKYRTHTMGLASCAPSDPFYPAFETGRRWYRDIFSRHSPPSTRRPDDLSQPYPANGPRKGILSIAIGDPALAPRINTVRA